MNSDFTWNPISEPDGSWTPVVGWGLGHCSPWPCPPRVPVILHRMPRPWGGGQSMYHSLRTQAGWKPRLVPSRPLLKWHLLMDSFPDGLSKIYPLTSHFIICHHIISYYLGINILRHINFYFYIIGAYYMTKWLNDCLLLNTASSPWLQGFRRAIVKWCIREGSETQLPMI